MRWSTRPLGDAPAALRDRAPLLIGFAGALRGGELVALTVADLERRPRGLFVCLRCSKTDQEGRGQHVAVLARPGSRYCPIAALDVWLATAGIASGPLLRRVYRSGRAGSNALDAATVAEIVKAAARRAGLDAARHSGHSLRRGFFTSAAESRASLLKLLEQSRHRRVESLRGYIAEADRFDAHAGAALPAERLDDARQRRRQSAQIAPDRPASVHAPKRSRPLICAAVA